METAINELRNLNAMVRLDPGMQGPNGYTQLPNRGLTPKDGHGYHNEQKSQSSKRNSMTPIDLWGGPVDHGIPRSKTDRKLTISLIYMSQSSSSSEQKSQLNQKNKVKVTQSISRLLPVYRPRTP